jgi:YHS domain-containing protein
MKKIVLRLLILTGIAALVLAASPGCRKKETEPAKKALQSAGHIGAEIRTVQKAKSFKVAFDNPRMGYCPVCGKPVNYSSFVSIGHKHYALCSDECAEILQDDPDQYLASPQPPTSE